MLKSMRWRLIFSAMLAFFAVITLIAILVNVVNDYVLLDRLDNTLSMIENYEKGPPSRENGEAPPAGPFMIFPDVESNYMMRFFVVRLDGQGEVLSVFTDFVASIDEAEAARYAGKAAAGKGDRGFIENYRYAKRQDGDGTTVVFLNAGRELQYMRSLRLLTLAVSIVSLVLVFVLVVLLSGRAIRPFENNIRRQKQFITDASHELKTPLTSISTSVEVIELEHGEDEWTENIKKQTGRMSHLVSELVTLSRLDEELPLPEKERFSLSNLAWEVLEIYQPQAKARGNTLTAEIEEEVELSGDKAMVRQLLSVLLDNAVRYSDPDSEIRFFVYRKRGRVRIDVFNTCSYEEPPDTERLFDRFYRPDGSRSTATGGTGVGLAIAKAVAEAHGGRISASCPSGKTMTIKVVL